MSVPAEARSRVQALHVELERHNRLYYIDDSPEISDAEYDRLFKENPHIKERYGNGDLGDQR